MMTGTTTATIGGVPHAYDLTGPLNCAAVAGNESLVFIHGWLLSRAYWRPLVSRLSDRYCCLTYDLRGFGESAQGLDARVERLGARVGGEGDHPALPTSDSKLLGSSPSAYSLAAYAQDLGALLDQMKLDRVWLLGHSLGGSIALWAAYLRPDRVKGVICINAGGGIYIPQEFEKFRAAGQQMVKFRPAVLAQLPLLPRLFSRLMVRQPLTPDWGRQRIRDFVRADRAAAEGALLDSTTCEEVHLLPRLVNQLTQPVHFITASQDRVMPPRYVRYLASFHPDFQAGFQGKSTVSELSDCGHMAMVERPDAVEAVVRSVLEQSARSVELNQIGQ